MTHKLERLLADLGEVSKLILNPFEHGVRFPLHGESLEAARSCIDQAVETLQNQKFARIAQRFAEAGSEFTSLYGLARHASIGGQMFDPDLRNQWGYAFINSRPNYLSSQLEQYIRSISFMQPFLANLAHIKSVMSTAAYIGSKKDGIFLFDIPVSSIGLPMSEAIHRDVYADASGLTNGSKIRSDWYTCAYLMARGEPSYAGHRASSSTHVHAAVVPARDQFYKMIVIEKNIPITFPGEEIGEKEFHALFDGEQDEFGMPRYAPVGALIDMENALLNPAATGRYDVDVITKNGETLRYYRRGANFYSQNEGPVLMTKDGFNPAIPPEREGTIFRIFIPVTYEEAMGNQVN